MSDRGMKKWAPYKSLIEHEPYLEAKKKEKEKITKPLISNEEAEVINEALINYHGQEVIITYFRSGSLRELEATIKKIDPPERKVVLANRITIYFKELIKIEDL